MGQTESKKPRKVKGKTIIDIERCKGCELCTTVCKEGAISMSKGVNRYGYRYAVVVNDLCTGCVNCALICPDGVIKVYRTSGKKREEIAEIKNVRSSIKVTIEENPGSDDLKRMEYL
ncbi:MAG: 4Fe-4S dicluster domain-containing protein [Ignavibacteria bacterium]